MYRLQSVVTVHSGSIRHRVHKSHGQSQLVTLWPFDRVTSISWLCTEETKEARQSKTQGGVAYKLWRYYNIVHLCSRTPLRHCVCVCPSTLKKMTLSTKPEGHTTLHRRQKRTDHGRIWHVRKFFKGWTCAFWDMRGCRVQTDRHTNRNTSRSSRGRRSNSSATEGWTMAGWSSDERYWQRKHKIVGDSQKEWINTSLRLWDERTEKDSASFMDSKENKWVFFYRAMLCMRGTKHVYVCPSVCLSRHGRLCLSVCLSVTSRSSTKTAKRRITKTTPHDSPGTLVFWCQRSPRNSTGATPYEDAKCRWGGSKSATFNILNRLYLENGTR